MPPLPGRWSIWRLVTRLLGLGPVIESMDRRPDDALDAIRGGRLDIE
jgi:hypothetical protein